MSAATASATVSVPEPPKIISRVSEFHVHPSVDFVNSKKLRCSTRVTARVLCARRVLWSVTLGKGKGVLLFCNTCFNNYFETREMEPETITRLSDSEEDFGEKHTCDKDDYRRKSRRFGSTWGRAKKRMIREPICQVPKPRRKQAR